MLANQRVFREGLPAYGTPQYHTYPLTDEMLQRSSAPYPSTDASVHRAFQRGRKRGVLKIIALGGSVTYGHDCVSPCGTRGLLCAWPARLQEWFNGRIKDMPVEVRDGY